MRDPWIPERRGFLARFQEVEGRLRTGTLSRRQAAKELQIGYATLKRLLDEQARSQAVATGDGKGDRSNQP